MQVQIDSAPAFAFAEITLPAGGAARVEAGAMATTRGDIEISTSTQGGFMRGLRRSLGGESFFVNDFTTKTGGTVGVAPVLPGDMALVPVSAQELFVASGGWIASDTSIDVDAKWGGAKGFFSGAGLVLLPCAALLGWFAGRKTLPRFAIYAVIGINLLWIADSIAILLMGWFAPTGLGIAFVLAQAAAVAIVTELEIIGFRRSGAALHAGEAAAAR